MLYFDHFDNLTFGVIMGW